MFIDLLYFLNISLSIIVGMFLWFKIKPIYSNNHTRTLALFLFLNAICFGFYLIIKNGFIVYVPYLYKVPAPITYLIVPAAYFHVCFFLRKKIHFTFKDLLHLLPFTLFLISYFPFYLQNLAQKSNYVLLIVADITKTSEDNIGLIPEIYNNLGRIIQPVFYLVLQWKVILSSKGKSMILENRIIYKWVLNFVKLQTFYLISLFLSAFTSTLFFRSISNEFFAYTTVILTVIFFFSISILLFWNENSLRKLKNFNPTIIKTSLEESKIIDITRIVRKEKYFIGVNNNLEGISFAIGLEKKELSKIINSQYNSFYEWINTIKIDHSIELVKKNYLQEYSVEALATECGFNSRNTFYRAFKKETGTTPIEFIKQLEIL